MDLCGGIEFYSENEIFFLVRFVFPIFRNCYYEWKIGFAVIFNERILELRYQFY